MQVKITNKKLESALIGGCILGGGGGGAIDKGRLLAEEALKMGDIVLKSVDDFSDNELIVTVSGVGAPAAKDSYAATDDYIKVVKLVQEKFPHKISGIITNENGGGATANGWIQSMALSIPIIDAPCNGRAHPTGLMGSLNLPPDYNSIQGFAGGNPKLGNYVEGVVSGSVEKTAKIVRQGAVEAGGLVVVARNLVTVGYIKKHAAIGGISKAIELGEFFFKGLEKSTKNAHIEVANYLKGEIVCSGKIKCYRLETIGGFDVGSVIVDGYEMTFWNEYMTIEKKGKRYFSFPDLIMTFSKITGLPLTTAELKENMEVVVIATDKKNIPLSSTMYNKEILKEVSLIIGKDIV